MRPGCLPDLDELDSRIRRSFPGVLCIWVCSPVVDRLRRVRFSYTPPTQVIVLFAIHPESHAVAFFATGYVPHGVRGSLIRRSSLRGQGTRLKPEPFRFDSWGRHHCLRNTRVAQGLRRLRDVQEIEGSIPSTGTHPNLVHQGRPLERSCALQARRREFNSLSIHPVQTYLPRSYARHQSDQSEVFA